MQTVLDPLVYFKLKSRVLELMLNEQEIIRQKQAAFAEVGLPIGQYLFEDASMSVTVLVPQSQVPVELPPPVDPPKE